ncbi:hypothetical protein [Nocardioides sp. T2.26MG-1]|uniref:hypothetical protein n=1 Tax=Nocardioides sp. T2.26MG-1 TaxID=3041166 RepID=UPI0024776D97|nr:hypothetical protein [Nocardioides sp. T2.26MG-1]CAI9417380.1 hypothetical protein HIDPHFAB_03005 [Nocardioides sp. T2.26MG-1]
MNDDQSLTGTTAGPTPSAVDAGAATPFGTPTPQAEEIITPPPVVRQWTIEEILGTARPPERHARVCLRGDLEAEHDMILAELAILVDARGKVIEDDEERDAATPSRAARARELAARDDVVRREMAGAMWYPLFKGLTSDQLSEFNGLHLPKPKPNGEDSDLTEYHTLLIAECSVASKHGPKLSVDDVRSLRAKLGARAVGALAKAAREASTQGGTDFPQLPPGWARLKEQ